MMCSVGYKLVYAYLAYLFSSKKKRICTNLSLAFFEYDSIQTNKLYSDTEHTGRFLVRFIVMFSGFGPTSTEI